MAEKSVPDSPPSFVRTLVSVKATIPTQPYGNIEYFVSQEVYTPASMSDENRSALILGEANYLHEQLTAMALPMVEAEVTRAKSILAKERFPDVWMRRNSPVYCWFRVAAPNTPIEAMSPFLTDHS